MILFYWAQGQGVLGDENSGIDAENARESENTTRTPKTKQNYVKTAKKT